MSNFLVNTSGFASGTTSTEHNVQLSDAIQTVIKSISNDGYTVASEGSDGYITFFTGSATVAGDNDLVWDRENNRLRLGGMMQFSGNTATFPAIKRVGEDLHFRKADDSAYTSIACANIDAYGTDIKFGVDDTSNVNINTGGGDIVLNKPLVSGMFRAPADAGRVIVMDMPVSDTPAAATEMSMGFAIDSNTCFTAYAEADSSGGVQEVKLKVDGYLESESGIRVNRVATATDYYVNGKEGLVAVTNTDAERTVFLPDAADHTDQVIMVKDESANAGTNNIIVDAADSSQNVDAGTVTISTDYGSASFYSDGSNWFSMGKDL